MLLKIYQYLYPSYGNLQLFKSKKTHPNINCLFIQYYEKEIPKSIYLDILH